MCTRWKKVQERTRQITEEALNTAAMEVDIENEHAQGQDAISSLLTPPGFSCINTPIYASPVVYSTVCSLREAAKDDCIYKRSYAFPDQQTSTSRKDYSAVSSRISKAAKSQEKRSSIAKKKKAGKQALSSTALKNKSAVKGKDQTLTKWLRKSLNLSPSTRLQKNTRRLGLNTPEVRYFFKGHIFAVQSTAGGETGAFGAYRRGMARGGGA